MDFASATMLSLRRSVHVVPKNGSVALTRSGRTPFSLRSDAYPVLPVLEALQAGTTFGELVAEFFANDEERAAKLVSLLLDRDMLMSPAHIDDAPSPYDRDRFDRLLAYFGEYETPGEARFEFLRRLQASHVVFLGLGSMTSWVMSHLVASGVGRITGVDPDKVELSNLARQAFYGEDDLGLAKTSASKNILARLNSATRFDGVAAHIASAADARSVLGDIDRPDLVILTADQPLWLIAEWVSTACAGLQLGLLRVNVQSVGPLFDGPGTACPACELGRLRRSPGAEELLSYRSAGSYRSMFNSATISTEIAIQGTLAAHEAIGYLSGAWQPDSVNGSLRLTAPPGLGAERRSLQPNPHCAACGPDDTAEANR
jgi:hypothetical protein